MSKVIGYLIGGSIILALGASGTQASKNKRAEAMERFEITETETPILEACTRTMSTYNVGFKTDVSKISGCACLARELSDRVHSSRHEASRAYMARLIQEGGDDIDVDFATDMLKIQQDHKLDARESGSILNKLGDAMEVCSDPRTHWTAAQAGTAEENMEQVKANFKKNANKPR